MKKPSERIRERVRYEVGPKSCMTFSEDSPKEDLMPKMAWITAILEYLDEQAEKLESDCHCSFSSIKPHQRTKWCFR